MLWPEYLNSRSQDLEPTFHDAGQFYSFNVVKFKKSKRLWTDNSGTILLSELQVQELFLEQMRVKVSDMDILFALWHLLIC